MTRPPAALTVGAQLEARRIGPITQTDIVRFAGAGGDFNPLHHDHDHAVRAGLPGVISMGQMQTGMLAAWLTDLVHVEHLLSYSVRFASPLRIGEILDLEGTVDEIDPATAVATVSLYAKAADRVVISGRARVRISLPR
ncbi:MaoC/PaaZ C-terminal domain-containing protein [Nocardia sp. alder85J]|uniref:MaoC/PaaZ C-terminal domain-containing protein n=1 Tax=Nocardia sp. alder85J TaxID=2862949 RepID=UPI001CD2ACE8|nr:MaoC/PaaZ C-terminal domain-containing protein [Nocardia sp. alder85J]MCX4096707.1 MaoC/PaaZ C-terminal domain-containing protein [Nocardia sp. alder85J]